MTKPLPIVAFVSLSERAAIAAAAGRIKSALDAASGDRWDCDCRHVENPMEAAAGAILVTSLCREAEGGEAWNTTEQRLRTLYADLRARDAPVFICTVLRHAGEGKAEDILRRRIRIRRLNMLAAEISRESGAFVIDLDRVLAHVGARRLGTDFRLEGSAAAEVAGHAIAIAVVSHGLDDVASISVQDKARDIIAGERLFLDQPTAIAPYRLFAIGQGRRRQLIAPTTPSMPLSVDRSAWIIKQVLKRQIGLRAAFTQVVRVMRRRGLKATATTLVSGALRLVARRS